MFSGIVQKVLTIKSISDSGQGKILCFEDVQLAPSLTLGDSVAIDGVCTTISELSAVSWKCQLGKETLAVTIAGKYCAGTAVNVELALRLSDRINGHLVSGHVDGVGKILSVKPVSGDQAEIWIQFPPVLDRYIAMKGSVALNGVSLTVNEVKNHSLRVNIIKHSLGYTTLQSWRPGMMINVEVDQIARYLEKLMGNSNADSAETSSMQSLLARNGFI